MELVTKIDIELRNFTHIFNQNQYYIIKDQMRAEGNTVYYLITFLDETVKFEDAVHQELYNNKRNGFVRKAIMGKHYPHSGSKKFRDPSFIMPPSKQYFLTSIYDLYGRDVEIFPDQQLQSSFIERQDFYCSAMGEPGIISFGYFRTLIMTQNITKIGRIQYFVKRQCQYYLEQCDDIIPVDKKTWKPLWGLTLKHPWQLVLLKIWLKQCKNWQNMWKAPPFALLDAFGLPAYAIYNFRKQLRFLKEQNLSNDRKIQNISNCALNNPRAIVYAKTIDKQQIKKVGLIPNQAAFRMMQYEDEGQLSSYRVFSGLPCSWVGQKTAVTKTQLNKIYQQNSIDLERSFMMSQQEVLNYFDKFYVVPYELCRPDFLLIQDCLSFKSNGQNQVWLQFQCKNIDEGLLSFTIEFPRNPNNSFHRYPDIRCILAKKNTLNQIKASHLKPSRKFIAESQSEGPKGVLYGDSNCDKWQHYVIQYMQGYHFNLTSFSKVNSGQYVMYIHINEPTTFKLRIDSQVQMSKPQVVEMPNQVQKQIFSSVFFQISEDMGVYLNLSRHKFPLELISINDNFEQLGFGSIAIKTLEKADFKIAMKIYPDQLLKYGIQIVKCYEPMIINKNGQRSLTMISQNGRPEVIVLQRTKDKRRQSRIQVQFPPPGSIQFFKVYPKQQNYYR